jgi:hypothetical protein
VSPALLAGWTPFFSTVAEAAATLAGLVMVAVSVNVHRIIAHKHLPARAFASIAGLVLILIVSLAALIPQTGRAFSLEIDLAAVFLWTMHVTTARQVLRGHAESGRPRYETLLSMIIGQVQVIPLTVGAILLALGHDYGLYWVAATILAALTFSVLNAWVLLVEILR